MLNDERTTDTVKALTGLVPAELLALEPAATKPGAVAFLSGSRVAGFGNVGSDIDLFVIGNGRPVGPFVGGDDSSYYHSQHYVAGQRVDVEIWRPEVVRALVARVANAPLNSPMPSAEFSVVELAFLDWLRRGIPLCEASSFQQWTSSADYVRLAQFLCYARVRWLDGALEDAIGMMDSGDYESAVTQGREIAETAADAFAFHTGSTCAKPKWRMKVLRSLDAPRAEFVRDRLWELSFPRAERIAQASGAREYVLECIGFAHSITDMIIP